MTLMSLTDCCRLLAIDSKTLRHWLAQAQLSPQAHPGDARIKGLMPEHLLLLAHAHHRRLADLCQEPSVSAPTQPAQQPPPLPAELLALLETLSTLPAQVAALQEQLAELSHHLPPPAQLSAGPARRPAAAQAPVRSRPKAAAKPKPPQPPRHVLPLVESAGPGQYVVICPKQGLLALEPNSPQWFAWLATLSSFRFVGQAGRFTAHRELERVPNAAWRAHRKLRNHSYNLRLGETSSLTVAVLEQAAADLQAHLA